MCGGKTPDHGGSRSVAVPLPGDDFAFNFLSCGAKKQKMLQVPSLLYS